MPELVEAVDRSSGRMLLWELTAQRCGNQVALRLQSVLRSRQMDIEPNTDIVVMRQPQCASWLARPVLADGQPAIQWLPYVG